MTTSTAGSTTSSPTPPNASTTATSPTPSTSAAATSAPPLTEAQALAQSPCSTISHPLVLSVFEGESVRVGKPFFIDEGDVLFDGCSLTVPVAGGGEAYLRLIWSVESIDAKRMATMRDSIESSGYPITNLGSGTTGFTWENGAIIMVGDRLFGISSFENGRYAGQLLTAMPRPKLPAVTPIRTSGFCAQADAAADALLASPATAKRGSPTHCAWGTDGAAVQVEVLDVSGRSKENWLRGSSGKYAVRVAGVGKSLSIMDWSDGRGLIGESASGKVIKGSLSTGEPVASAAYQQRVKNLVAALRIP